MLSTLFALAAMPTWSMPAQAAWPAQTTPTLAIELKPTATPISIKGQAEFVVELRAPSGEVSVAPYITTTRGISLDVRDAAGKDVPPREPMPGSPPPPPYPNDQLIRLGATTPYPAEVREYAKWLFPGPGTYRVRAIVVLRNFSEANWTKPEPRDGIGATSPWISVVVTE